MRHLYQRYRSLVPIGIGLFGVLVLICGSFQLAGFVVPGWLPHKLAGLGFSEDIRKRALSAARQYETGAVGGDKSLCVVLGLSGASEGIDLKTVAEQDGGRCHYLGLARGGRNLRDIRDYVRPVQTVGLHPDLAILAISPFHLVDARYNRNDPRASIPQIDKPGILIPAKSRLPADHIWVVERRQDVSQLVEAALLKFRFDLIWAFKQDLPEYRVDPWAEMPKLGYPEHSTPAFMGWSLDRYRLRGYYDAKTYRNSVRSGKALIAVVRLLRKQGAWVIFVLMPEHSALRRRIPPQAMETLASLLEKAFGKNAPAVVDRRSAIDDSGFMDIAHMNSQGRRAFSQMLGRIVSEHFDGKVHDY